MSPTPLPRRLLLPLVLLAAAFVPLPARAQASAADSAAIRATALDYAMGWYTGDGDRMARALHPDLAKRDIIPDSTGAASIRHMTAEALVVGTQRGWGTGTPESERRAEVTILDVFGNTASVRTDMRDWIDYMHLARLDGTWQIVNVLWDLRPEPDAASR